MIAGSLIYEGIFLEYIEAEIPKIRRKAVAQMKKGILIKNSVTTHDKNSLFFPMPNSDNCFFFTLPNIQNSLKES